MSSTNGASRDTWMIELRSAEGRSYVRSNGGVWQFTTQRQAEEYCRRIAGALLLGVQAAVVPYRPEAEQE